MIFFFLLLLTLSLGALMSLILDTRTSSIPANYLAYVPRPCAVLSAPATRLVAVPCHNYPTASAYAAGRLPAVTAARDVAPLTDEQRGGCTVGGAGYDAAVTWVLTGRVERCHNWATAKTIARNNPVTAGLSVYA